MTRMLLTLATALTLAAPASAMSFQVDLPILTYPPVATPDTTQGCTDMTTLNDAACTTTSK